MSRRQYPMNELEKTSSHRELFWSIAGKTPIVAKPYEKMTDESKSIDAMIVLKKTSPATGQVDSRKHDAENSANHPRNKEKQMHVKPSCENQNRLSYPFKPHQMGETPLP